MLAVVQFPLLHQNAKTLRNCQEITWTDSAGFLCEGKEAETARAQRHVRLSADTDIVQKDKEDVQVIF